jgi:hypothetical protein
VFFLVGDDRFRQLNTLPAVNTGLPPGWAARSVIAFALLSVVAPYGMMTLCR